MKTFLTFIKKELMEQIRTKRLMILGMIFLFFGILNPLTAKITPWLLESLSNSVDNSGIIIQVQEITALDSWMQFFKNLPMLLIVYIFMQSNIFSKEYQKGTLTLVITKGFEKYKIVLSKLLLLILIWTVGYVIYFSVTYIYSSYFWDNSIVSNLLFATFISWVFSIFAITLLILFNVIFDNSGSSLALSFGIIFVFYLISLIPDVSKYLPTLLLDGNSLIYGKENIEYYIASMIITLSLTLISIFSSAFIFNKRKI